MHAGLPIVKNEAKVIMNINHKAEDGEHSDGPTWSVGRAGEADLTPLGLWTPFLRSRHNIPHLSWEGYSRVWEICPSALIVDFVWRILG
jgi:hypothetical protein